MLASSQAMFAPVRCMLRWWKHLAAAATFLATALWPAVTL